jgi:hypothetical protein
VSLSTFVNCQAVELSNIKFSRIKKNSYSANEAITKLRNIKIYDESPLWVKMHALLLYAGDTLDKKNQILSEIMRSSSNAENENSFTLRRDLPFIDLDAGEVLSELYQNQFLFYFSLLEIPIKEKIVIDRRNYKFEDYLANVMLETRLYTENDFGVAGLYYYYGLNKRFVNKYYENISVLDMIYNAINNKNHINKLFMDIVLTRILRERSLNKDKMPDNLRKELLNKQKKALFDLKAIQAQDGSITPSEIYCNPYLYSDSISKKIYTSSLCLIFMADTVDDSELDSEWLNKLINYIVIHINGYTVSDGVELMTPQSRAQYSTACLAGYGLKLWLKRCQDFGISVFREDFEGGLEWR